MAENRESDSDTSDNESAKETSSDSESDSEPELNQTQITKKPLSSTPVAAAAKKPVHQSASKPAQQPSPTSSESGSDSDSDPKDSPIPAQAKEPPQNGARKSRTKPAAADPVTPTRSAAKKRPADEKGTEPKAAKKAQKKAESDTPKKSIIQRYWTEGDELVILKGMIDYRDKKKADPTADVDDFHESIKKNLDTKDSATSQLLTKIKRMKKKYENLKMREEKKDGKEMTFSKPHEQKAYELSKRVWGNSKATDKEEVAKKEASKRTVVVADGEAKKDKALVAEIESFYRVGGKVDDRVFSIGVELFENGKGDSAGEKEWRKLKLEEMQANLRLCEVKTAQARLVVDCLMSQGI